MGTSGRFLPATYFELADKRILRVVEKFREIGEFERKVELLLRDWIKSNVSQGTIWPIEEKVLPFAVWSHSTPSTPTFIADATAKFCAIDELLIAGPGKAVPAHPRGERLRKILAHARRSRASDRAARHRQRSRSLANRGDAAGDRWQSPAGPGTGLVRDGQRRNRRSGRLRKGPTGNRPGAFKTPERLALFFKSAAEVAVDPLVAALEDVGKSETEQRGFERPLQANLLLLVDQLEDIFAESVTPEDRLLFANVLGAP